MMKMNLQMFGGRGANSRLSNTATAATTAQTPVTKVAAPPDAKTTVLNELQDIVNSHVQADNGYHYDIVTNDWNNYGKSRTYIKVVVTRDNSKHYDEYNCGYFDNISDRYVSGKFDITAGYDLSGNRRS